MSTLTAHPTTTSREKLAAHFAVGNIILSNYWKKFDLVLNFSPSGEGDPWYVQVVECDRDGKALPGMSPRYHCTYPDARDVIVGKVNI